tara:strand:+ start:8402 stop:8626 length:225 start_codon:yes stop_codon:yes gene_type:complete
MNNLQILTTQRLTILIDETQQTLQELKEEVIRREQLQQEREVMHLDHHMKSAELNLTHIKNFLAYLIDDHKDKK